MLYLKLIVITGLATLAASHSLSPRSGDPSNSAGKGYSSQSICTTYANLSTYAAAKLAWDSTGAGQWLSSELAAGGELGWLGTAERKVFPEYGPSNLDGCLIAGGDCTPDPNCTLYMQRNQGPAFYVLSAVQGLNGKMTYIRDSFQDGSIIAGINVAAIAQSFKTDLTGDQNTLKYVGAAFSTLGGALTAAQVNPEARGAMGILGGLFSAAGVPNQSYAPSGTAMTNWLSAAFQATAQKVDDILTTALGGQGNTSTLPKIATTYNTNVANFFAEGVWLVDDVNQVFRDAVANGKTLFNKKLVDFALDSLGARLIADTDILTAEDCTGTGHLWLDAKGTNYCFYLTRLVGKRNSVTDCSGELLDCEHADWIKEVGAAFYGKLTTQGLGLEVYYKALIDCSINGSPEINIDSLPTDGSTPRCFFNLPAKKIKWKDRLLGLLVSNSLTTEAW
ncbi:Uu.00g120560.m01.CDS01 [Anthostomella pinea]|uniref:Uu.00g120560.m01.CDS01 n=1 Tax=Anthostomella pinea TaxID=933095 RepID=A0AAI8VGV7_9PEZI|nr:Uu.00g120560.m01.CDS01 [Anthostomella pinea]